MGRRGGVAETGLRGDVWTSGGGGSDGTDSPTCTHHDKNCEGALAGEAQWIECWPVNQRVSGSIPSQDLSLIHI